MSETYQRSSEPLPGQPRRSALLQPLLSAAAGRRSTARRDLAGDRRAESIHADRLCRQRLREDGHLPDGYACRCSLYDSAVVSSFLETFGRNERDITCECERSNTPSIVQVLHINNGVTINERLQDRDSCVARALAGSVRLEAIIETPICAVLAASLRRMKSSVC